MLTLQENHQWSVLSLQRLRRYELAFITSHCRRFHPGSYPGLHLKAVKALFTECTNTTFLFTMEQHFSFVAGLPGSWGFYFFKTFLNTPRTSPPSQSISATQRSRFSSQLLILHSRLKLILRPQTATTHCYHSSDCRDSI